MSVAIIQTGGKQYLVHEGDKLVIERINADENSVVSFPDLLNGKSVQAKVVAHSRAEKVRVVKFRSKVRYLRRRGHRQQQSQLLVESIK